MLHAVPITAPQRTVSPHAELARRAVFGTPDDSWTFVEAGTLAWQQWCRFCRAEIGREPVAALIFGSPPGRPLGRYRGRSLPTPRPPGASALDRMRIASGERDDDEAAA